MKKFLFLPLIFATVCLADPVPVATPVPAPVVKATPAKTFYVLPEDRPTTAAERAAERAEADKKAAEIMEAVRKRREAEALERIARALEERR